jgi:hypothetical protein
MLTAPPTSAKVESAGCALKRTDLVEQDKQDERGPPVPSSLNHAVSKFQRSEHLEHSTINFERLSFLTCSMRFLRLKLNISHLSDGGAVCKQRFLKYSVSDISGTPALARYV